ncbi:hypothetical protein CLAIMM_01907 [Cladophialophora immunda]|nr:hypothetical protein CLAIMM_01907 [Cladophialophora immunda]
MSALLGSAYDSSDDERSPAERPPPSKEAAVNAAPDVSTEDVSQMQVMLANPSSNALTYNVTYDNLARPSQGPSNPFKSTAGNA